MNSMTLTTEQLISILDFLGLSVDHDHNDDLECLVTIDENQKITNEDGTIYEGMAAYITEYPEEGSIPLEDVESNSIKPDPLVELFANKISDHPNTGNYLPEHKVTYKLLVDAGVDLNPFLKT